MADEPEEHDAHDEIDLVDGYFADIYAALNGYGVPEDRMPTTVQILSHVMECVDEARLDAWIQAYAVAESPSFVRDGNE